MATILILENDSDLCVIAEAALRAAGHDVAVAYTVDDAIAKCMMSPPALAVVDLMLSAESGWDFIAWAREHERPMRIAAHTVHQDEPGHLERARQFAVDAMVPKTGDPTDLVRAVQEILAKSHVG